MKLLATLLLASCIPLMAARAPWTTHAVKGSPEPPSPYTLEPLFPELDLERPVEFQFAPDSEDLFILTERGQFWHVDTTTSPSRQTLVAHMRDLHQPLGNALGFTFHPNFKQNRYVYINFNEGGQRDQGAHIGRFEMTDQAPYNLVAESKKVLISWACGGHNGCTLAFGPDGYLYFSAGDGASPDPPDGRFLTGQDNSDIMGSIQRIDVDREANGKPYAIPPDNPFVNHRNTRPEVWAFGFRNPFRMAFDQRTGELWAGDVGWEQWEMIYWIRRGGNYGWPITEGPNPRIRPETPKGPGPILPPMVAHSHTEAASMTGGQVYYGERYPDLHGCYIYGDWESGRLWALRNRADQLTFHQELCDTAIKPVSFALDPSGELLILDHNSGIYGLIPNPVQDRPSDFPTQLSQTGLFTSTQDLSPAPGTVSYQPVAPMWNDYATAQWLLGVPDDGAIAPQGGVRDIAGANWYYPTNTVLARTLTLPDSLSKPTLKRKIETQLLHWDGQEWHPYTYRWNEAQTDADLVGKNGTSTRFTVSDDAAPGGLREIPWRFHSRTECLRCHNAWSGNPLTINSLQLGSGEGSETERFKQLEVMAVNNRQNGRGRRRNTRAQLVNPYHETEPVAARARSWLHVNCGSCHIFGAGGAIPSQFNIDKRLEEARSLDTEPTRGTFDLPNAKILASGDPHRSVVAYRVSTEGAGHMPQIGSRLVDEKGVAVLMEWLTTLPSDASDTKTVQLKKQAKSAATHADPATIASLLESTRGGLALVQAGLTEPGNQGFRSAVASLAKQHDQVFVRELFQHWLKPGDRRQTLGTDIQPETILSLSGDSLRGEELFFGASQCSTCHQLSGQGRNFGPDLTQSATRYDRTALLDHILNPSKTVLPEYRTVSLTLANDTELTGLISGRTATHVTLVDTALKEHAIAKTAIVDQYESTLSAMPEGLLASLTAQEAADLIRYLTSLKR